MKFSKMITVNIGGYESVKLGVDDASSFSECDGQLITELTDLGIPVSKKIKQCLVWEEE